MTCNRISTIERNRLPRRAPRTNLETLETRRLMATTPFDVPVVPSGQTAFTLHPVESVAPNQQTRVSFGVPFPKGFVTDLSRVRLLGAGGAEQAVSVQELTPWRDLATLTNLNSVRSALVQADVSFPDTNGDGRADPLPLSIEWGGAARTVPALSPVSVRSTWVAVNDADFPASHGVYEPKAYALFSADWYGQSMLKSRLQPFGTENDPSFASYENYFLNFGRTAVNDVDPRVTDANRVHYLTDYDPWLFDRASTLFQLAFRSGRFDMLREAHRASQFYANHIGSDGYFDLRGGDMKYVYGENVSTDYWLTGDDRLPAVARRMIPAFDGFNATYTTSTGFWTERHAAFKLLGYTSGFELLGDAAIGQKAQNTFNAYFNMQSNPVGGAPSNGLLMHTSASHGEGGGELVASPWMSVLLVDAVERYYVHSGDARVKQFVTRMADGINRVGESVYTGTFNGRSVLVPYYLAGPNLTADQHAQDIYADVEHAADVSKIFALAYFFTRADGAPNAAYLGRFNDLSNAADAAFDHWYRPGAASSGLTEYRLTPPRKFNWWFRTTADNDYLVAGDIGAPTPPPPPGQGVVQFGSAAYTAGEAAGTFTVTVTRTGDTTGAATVSYSTSNGTATAGSDYAAASGTLSFAAGETSKTFAISILNDTLVEADETVTLTLANPTGATLGGNTAVLTIRSDDMAPPPTVQFGAASYAAAEGAGSVTVTVTRSGSTSSASTVAYTVTAGTATAGSDFVAASGTISFAAGETTKTFTVQVINDSLVEAAETVLLALTNPSGATLGAQSTAVLTITSDDLTPRPAVELSAAAYGVAEGGGFVNVTVTRSGDTSADSSVTLVTSDSTAAAGADYAVVSTVVTFGPGETTKVVAVPVHDDAAVEGSETFTVSLRDPSGAVLGARVSAVVTISDDDVAPPPPPTAGTIAGTVFYDVDGDGILTAGEAGLAGRQVYLDVNGDSICNAGEPSCVTGADGSYRFDGLAAGSYRVMDPGAAGWYRTSPLSGCWSITLADGQVAAGLNFGEALPGSITGRVFKDSNANGRRDRKESYLAQVRVFLDADNDGVLDAGEATVLTNRTGTYTFTGLCPANHAVRVVPKAGWRPTIPTDGLSSVAVRGGQITTDVLFGLKRIT